MKKLILIMCAMFSLTACLENFNKSAPPESKVNRYQLLQLGSMRRDQYLLDTETGKLWSNTCGYGLQNGIDCEVSYWMENDVVGLNSTLDRVIARVQYAKESKVKK